MTTVGYPDITGEFVASLDPLNVCACLRIAGYARVDEWSSDRWMHLVRVDGHDTVTVPLNRDGPRYGEQMREALLKVRGVVELGDMVRVALNEIGVDTGAQLTSQFVMGDGR